jgi:hypothetical protein
VGGNTGLIFLGKSQAKDGAALSANETLNNRVWATSYAIPAVLSMPWSVILHSVSKPIALGKIAMPTLPSIAVPIQKAVAPSPQKKVLSDVQSAPAVVPEQGIAISANVGASNTGIPLSVAFGATAVAGFIAGMAWLNFRRK